MCQLFGMDLDMDSTLHGLLVNHGGMFFLQQHKWWIKDVIWSVVNAPRHTTHEVGTYIYFLRVPQKLGHYTCFIACVECDLLKQILLLPWNVTHGLIMWSTGGFSHPTTDTFQEMDLRMELWLQRVVLYLSCLASFSLVVTTQSEGKAASSQNWVCEGYRRRDWFFGGCDNRVRLGV